MAKDGTTTLADASLRCGKGDTQSLSMTVQSPPATSAQPSVKTSPEAVANDPYTVFSKRQKRLLTFIVCITTVVSPLTATSFLPLLPLLRTHFHTTQQAINLTITLYIVFQALSPFVFATLSDTIGRRPVYLITFAIFTLASLGLALNRTSYPGLLILRALQSLGASAVIAVAYAVAADVCVPAERGSMIGYIMAATNVGPCIGPLVGGGVALASDGFIWVFWGLVVFGALILTVLGFFLIETARNVVGNGSKMPQWWQKTWLVVLMDWKIRRRADANGEKAVEGSKGESTALTSFPTKVQSKRTNLLTSLRIIFWKDTSLVLWVAGSFYAVYYCIQTINPVIYKETYGFNELEIGLAYLPGGAGVIIGGFVTGKMLDRNYKLTAKTIGHTVDRVRGDDLAEFPIERARTRSSEYMLIVGFCALTGFGWSVNAHAHPSIPMSLQCVMGFICTFFLQAYSALLVDVFPQSPGTAATSNNIIRCTLAAIGVAVTQPLTSAMGIGWYFTFLSALSGIGGAAAVWAIRTYGMEWRGQRMSSRRPRADETQEEENKIQC